MKKLAILGSTLLFAGSALAAPSNDSEQITISAAVDVNANCELQYEGSYGPLTGTLAPGQNYSTGPIAFDYGCNAPYSLKLAAQYGQLTNTGDTSIGIGYTLLFNGNDLGITPSNKTATLDTVADYASLTNNTNTGNGAVELTTPGATDIVAGTYEETVTVTLASNL